MEDATPAPDAAVSEVQRVMERHGWQSAGVRRFPEGMPLTAVRFSKPSCATTLTVTLMGSKAELQDYVRQLHDGDVTFVQDGHANHSIGASDGTFGRLERLMTWVSGGGKRSNMPILAISPASASNADCAAPDASAWTAHAAPG